MVESETKHKYLSSFVSSQSFVSLGIGGLDKQMSTIIRRVFLSRTLDDETRMIFGAKHVKGILLHGPPGCGKTLIARQIAKIIDCTIPPRIVNGPELFNKYVGETEKNIRDLFEDANDDQRNLGSASPLHIIIFDEFDAMFKHRGMDRSNSGTNDTAVNQLLSVLDGVEQLDNILVFGLTNRKDLIDEALLRPGRFEVHIDISLPDEEGRLQILDIHTSSLSKHKLLCETVNLQEIARNTRNYTGAELEAIVNSAKSFALERRDSLELPKVTQKDFLQALKEIKPQFGVDVEESNLTKLIDYGNRFSELNTSILKILNRFERNSDNTATSILLHGDSGCGKSTIAAYFMKKSNFPYIKILRGSSLLNYNKHEKIELIRKIFQDSQLSSKSLIVLEDIERIIELVGCKFSRSICSALLSLIGGQLQNSDYKRLVLVTTSQLSSLEQLGLGMTLWDYSFKIPNLSQEEIKKVIVESYPSLKREERYQRLILDRIKQIPIKKLLRLLSHAKDDDFELLFSIHSYSESN